MNKEELLKHITDFYLQSHDFNGCPNYSLPAFSEDDLAALIEDDKVFIISESDDINIHINRCNCFQDKSVQVQAIHNHFILCGNYE